MYVIENLKAVLRHSDKISECIELAIKIQSLPNAKKSSEDLAEVLGMIQRMILHLSKQIEKGIAMEEELNKIATVTKDLPGANIYVGPWGCIIDSPSMPG